MTGLPVLYSFRRCPYAMRARLAVLASGLTVRLREVALRDKPAEMLAISPKGTVPVLHLADGRVIEQSREIMVWALSAADPDGLLSGWDSVAAQTLIERNDGPFKQALDRYKYHSRHEGADAGAERERAAVILHDLDRRLADMGGQVLRPDVSAVDLALFPFVRQFAETDRDWFDAQPWPHLARWLAGHIASPAFAAVMVRHAPWQAGAEEPLFP